MAESVSENTFARAAGWFEKKKSRLIINISRLLGAYRAISRSQLPFVGSSWTAILSTRTWIKEAAAFGHGVQRYERNRYDRLRRRFQAAESSAQEPPLLCIDAKCPRNYSFYEISPAFVSGSVLTCTKSRSLLQMKKTWQERNMLSCARRNDESIRLTFVVEIFIELIAPPSWRTKNANLKFLISISTWCCPSIFLRLNSEKFLHWKCKLNSKIK